MSRWARAITSGDRLQIPTTVSAADAAEAVWAFELYREGQVAEPVVQLGPDDLTVELVDDTDTIDQVIVYIVVPAAHLLDVPHGVYIGRLKQQTSIDGPDTTTTGSVTIGRSSLDTGDLADVSADTIRVRDFSPLNGTPDNVVAEFGDFL